MKRLVTSILIIVACMTFTACRNTESDNKHALAIVIGNHANSQELNFNSPTLKTAVTDAVSSYGQISIVNLDGEPEVVACDSYDIDNRYKKAAKSKLEADAKKKAETLMAALPTVKAKSSEVDIIKGLVLAARTMADLPEETEKTILVIDTGISTTGILDFTNGILEADPDGIATQLEVKGALPNMEGINVIWQQMGDVAGNQAELSNAQRNKLTNIWTEIITRAGGNFTLKSDLANRGVNSEGFPKVTAVTIPEESAISFCGQKNVDLSNPLIINEEYISFIADTADFINEENVRDTLKPVKKYMDSNKNFVLLLVGTTAGDGESSFNSELSLKRAKSVAKTLISLGVDESRIVPIGLGSTDPWHIKDLGVGPEAACNRKCVLLDAESDMGKSIITL